MLIIGGATTAKVAITGVEFVPPSIELIELIRLV